MHVLLNNTVLQEQADNNLLCDLLLCQIAPSTPLTLWELFSLLSVLLWAFIVHYVHSLQWMYLNVLWSSTIMNTFFAFLGFLHGHWNQYFFHFFFLSGDFSASVSFELGFHVDFPWTAALSFGYGICTRCAIRHWACHQCGRVGCISTGEGKGREQFSPHFEWNPVKEMDVLTGGL